MTVDLYKALGVSRKAGAEDIRKAFKTLAKTCHPDVVGGENEAFDRIRQAYDVLLNPASRKAYDDFGIVPGDDSTAVILRAHQELSNLLAQALFQGTPDQFEKTDVIGKMKEAVDQALTAINQKMRELEGKEKHLDSYRRIMDKRLKHKAKSGVNIFADTIAGMAKQIAAQKSGLTNDRAVKEAMLKLLKVYRFDFEKGIVYAPTQTAHMVYTFTFP